MNAIDFERLKCSRSWSFKGLSVPADDRFLKVLVCTQQTNLGRPWHISASEMLQCFVENASRKVKLGK